ncbi:MAG: hypothetical protein JSV24_05365, partial [Bacteroidales bacterium]
ANRRQLIMQFLGESVLISVIALILSLGVTQLLLPLFNSLSGKHLILDISQSLFVIEILCITIVVGLVSGSYPSFFLSSFTPNTVLQGKFRSGPTGALIRKGLVLVQFTVSGIFIIGTLVVNRQMNFIQNKNLGFDKERILVIPLGDPRARQIYLTCKQQLLEIPDVISVTAALTVPGGLINNVIIEPEGRPEGEEVMIDQILVDHDFISTFRINLLKGRDFSLGFPADTMTAFIINESAVSYLGWDDQPFGKRIKIGDWKQGKVIGVVENFHTKSLHQRIEPLLLHIATNPDSYHYFIIRIGERNIEKTIEVIEERWYRVYPQDPFVYSFLSQDFDSLYRHEELRGRIFTSFSFLAIFIACLGLFGLASYTAEVRTKEIGIRKVFGATIISVILRLSREFTWLIVIANIIAWPVAYFIMKNWLKNFAYRTGIPLWIYVLAYGISSVIALLTVSFQSFRAAGRNPADSLRYE